MGALLLCVLGDLGVQISSGIISAFGIWISSLLVDAALCCGVMTVRRSARSTLHCYSVIII